MDTLRFTQPQAREKRVVTPLAAENLYDWLLLLHLLAAMVWFGSVVILTVLSSQVVRSGEPAAVARFLGSLQRFGPLLLAPAMLAVLGFGIWLVVEGELWNFSQTWVTVGITLFAVAFLIGVVFQSRAAIGAQRAAEAGNTAEAIRLLRRWSLGMRLILVLLVVATWDMVIKPGL